VAENDIVPGQSPNRDTRHGPGLCGRDDRVLVRGVQVRAGFRRVGVSGEWGRRGEGSDVSD